MTRLDTLFFDVGGVCLTNGWDTDARLAAASHFALDVGETEDRHQALADGFERGELSLDAYLDPRPQLFARILHRIHAIPITTAQRIAECNWPSRLRRPLPAGYH